MGEVLGSVLTFGGIAVVVLVYFFSDREEKRALADGTEQERFEIMIDDVVMFWHAAEVDRELRRELKEDLDAFCFDARRSGATTTEVFGNDIEAFADMWISEHRQPPNPLKVALLRLLNYASLWMGYRSALSVIRAFRETTTDETWTFTLAFSLAIGLVAGAGPLITLVTGRSFWLTGSWLVGLGKLVCTGLAGVAILLGSLLMAEQLAGAILGISLGPADVETVPSMVPWLISFLVALPIWLRATTRLSEENDKRFDSLLGEIDDDDATDSEDWDDEQS